MLLFFLFIPQRLAPTMDGADRKNEKVLPEKEKNSGTMLCGLAALTLALALALVQRERERYGENVVYRKTSERLAG